MSIRLAINGFGRIGRNVLRALAREDAPDVQLVAVNDLMDAHTLAHLLKYDSVHGAYPGSVEVAGDGLVVDGGLIRVFAERDPGSLPWGELGVDVVVESTGFFRDREGAGRHLAAGAGKVIVSAPGKDVDVTLVLGVNHDAYDPDSHHIISNASCTTNCLAPVVKVLNDRFGFQRGLVTTIHSYTNGQALLDQPHKDLRRARAGAVSMIPTTTGAARATGVVIPEVHGRIDGMAVRVPTPNVSLVDIVAEVEHATDITGVNQAMRDASAASMRGILDVSDEPLVSVDYIGNPASSVVDALSTNVIDDRLVKVLSWYDNEAGYSSRVVDLVRFVGERMMSPAAV
ncbi:MAG: type I glyceraldehyde-3-phosphate dehydrogenase [Gammaproteobacteria bacterium]|nr:type I glyceraldehyde-3-phosphate dehydrogenase [Gammaproteobacteria bacterium]MDE0258172.1 type I glyceraldehyde-3-phosphate dehydrogenase [Gammaproteobacteria bacterium]